MTYLLLQGDARHIPLADESVQCVVTSPPYYGLRDYGTARWEGGDPECEHKVGRFESPCSEKQRSNNGSAGHSARDVCPHCGARRIDSQIGLEQSPDDYVAQLVAVFREVWRVLRKDGVCWLNIGDSYASGAGGRGDVGNIICGAQTRTHAVGEGRIKRDVPNGLKPKDLCGIPWRVALAL